MSSELFERHRGLLEMALAATATRGAFSAYPDRLSDYNEVVQADGREAFDNYCNSFFYLDQPGVGERVGHEASPYGIHLNIQYPKTNLSAIMPAAVRAKDQTVGSVHPVEHRVNFSAGKHHGQALRAFRAFHPVQPKQLRSQYLLIKKQQSTFRLILSGGRDIALHCKVGKKGLHVFRAEITRMAPVMEPNEPAYPIHIRGLRPDAVML